MCNTCNQPDYSCTCGCSECVDNCPIKLDFSCILYNKEGRDISALTGLNVPNGTTLKLIVELLDQKIRQLDIINYSLPVLRTNHTVNTLQKFGEAVDTEIGLLKTSISSLSSNSNLGITSIPSTSVVFTLSGTLNHTVKADVKIGSPDTANCLIVQSDGLVAVPQTLSLNYTTKQLSISKGNSINLGSLISSNFLGNLTDDPSGAIDGNYWYNKTQSKLKIRVNSVVKTILTD